MRWLSVLLSAAVCLSGCGQTRPNASQPGIQLLWAGADYFRTSDPEWAPDGSALAVIVEQNPPLSSTGVVIVETRNGTAQEVVLPEVSHIGDVAWNPDATHIVVSRHCAQITSVAVTSPYTATTLFHTGCSAAWDHERGFIIGNVAGEKLWFTRYASPDNLEKTGEIDISDGSYLALFEPSPVSDELLLTRIEPDSKQTSIWRQELEPSKPKLVSPTRASFYSPSWSPDGRWIAAIEELLVSGTDGRTAAKVVLIASNSQCLVPLLDISAAAEVDWSPTQAQLVLSTGHELYRLDIETILGVSYIDLSLKCGR